jgi:hypothetical protein
MPMRVNGNSMSGRSGSKQEAVPDYDFTGGVRGKYAARFAAGTNVVVLSPDVAELFQDSEAVNEALREFVGISAKSVRTRSTRKEPELTSEGRSVAGVDAPPRRNDVVARKIRGDARVGTVEKRLGLKPGAIRNPDGTDARSDKRLDTLRKQQKKK